MKQTILDLLAGDSFAGFLEGVEQTETAAEDNSISTEEWDQELMERLCAVLIPDQWAEHDDYIATLSSFMDTLPGYMEYIADDDIGHHLRGLAIFIDGVVHHTYQVDGFIYNAGNGYLMSLTAAESIAEHFTALGKSADAAFFQDLSQWFHRIYSAQMGVVHIVMNLETWNEGMADGFYNILTSAPIDLQGWMLGGLYKVTEQPAVKDGIFGKYLSVLKNVKQNYDNDGQEDEAGQVQSIIDMVEEKAAGN